VFKPTVVVGGQVAGTWQRVAKGRGSVVTVTPFTPLAKGVMRGLEEAAGEYGRFLGTDVRVEISKS
jgi:hypothetical protein